MRRPPQWMALILAVLGLAFSSLVVSALADEAAPSEWKAPARASRKKNPIPPSDQSIAAGKDVYVKQCLSCHGDAGKGDGPAAKDLTTKPRDLSDPAVTSQTDGTLFWKISEGRKPMPSFSQLLPEEDRWNVVNYIRTLAPPPATQPSDSSSKPSDGDKP